MLTAHGCSVGGGGACFGKFMQTLTEIHFKTILLSFSLKRVFLIVYIYTMSLSFEDDASSFQLEGAFFTCLIIGLLPY